MDDWKLSPSLFQAYTHTHTHTCSTPFYRGIGEVNHEGIRLVVKMRLGPPQSLSDNGLFPGHGAKAGLHNSVNRGHVQSCGEWYTDQIENI